MPFNQTPGFANINESNNTVSVGGKCEVGKLRHRALKLLPEGDPWLRTQALWHPPFLCFSFPAALLKGPSSFSGHILAPAMHPAVTTASAAGFHLHLCSPTMFSCVSDTSGRLFCFSPFPSPSPNPFYTLLCPPPSLLLVFLILSFIPRFCRL